VGKAFRSLPNWQLLACALGMVAGFVPGVSFTSNYWSLFHFYMFEVFRVTEVLPGSPPARDGFRSGDVIVDPKTLEDVKAALDAVQRGEARRFTVRRGEDEVVIEATPTKPELAAIWYANPWYPIAGGLFLGIGILVFATAPVAPAPWWRSGLVIVAGLGIAVGFAVEMACGSVFARFRVYQRWPMGVGDEWYAQQGWIGVAAGVLLACFAAAEIRRRLARRQTLDQPAFMHRDQDILPPMKRTLVGGRITLRSGLEAFGGGIGFVMVTPRVWGYALVPVGMLLLLSCGLTGLAVWGSHHLSTWLIGPNPSAWGQTGYWSLIIALGVVGFIVAVLMALSLAQPLSGFALESIAHAQEIALMGTAAPKTSFFVSLVSTTKAVVVALLIGGTLLVLLFLISFFFPPAAVVTVPLKVLVCGWMLAWDFIDYPLAMRGVGLEGRFAWVGRNFGAFTLFGVLWALLLVVPGMQLVILPMGVAGATRLVVADEVARHIRRGVVETILPA
jgi:CysZ protein